MRRKRTLHPKAATPARARKETTQKKYNVVKADTMWEMAKRGELRYRTDTAAEWLGQHRQRLKRANVPLETREKVILGEISPATAMRQRKRVATAKSGLAPARRTRSTGR